MKFKQDKQEELIIKAKAGDINALEELLKEAEKRMYSLLYHLTCSECEASDIVQESLLKIAKKLKDLKEPKFYESWLNKIVIREYYTHLRKCKKREEKIISEDICEIEDEKCLKDKKMTPAEDCINCELTGVIKKSICKLSEPYKLAILLREFEGLSYDEIAEITKTTVGTVKSRIARARNRLKEYIQPYME